MPTFDTPQPISLSVDIVGDLRITASDRRDTIVAVGPLDATKAADVTAAQETIVEFAAGTLTVRTPKHWTRFTPFGGGESVYVTIEVPTGSQLDGVTGLGDIVTEGELGSCRVKTAMGNIRLDHTGDLRATSGYGNVVVDRVAGEAQITTGSGDLRIGEITGPAIIKNSNGPTEIGAVGGTAKVKSANGEISIGRAATSTTARTSNGDIRIREVNGGAVVVETATGDLEVGVHHGIAAWLDLQTRFGSVRNELATADGPASNEGTVEIRANTPAGDIVITRAPEVSR